MRPFKKFGNNVFYTQMQRHVLNIGKVCSETVKEGAVKFEAKPQTIKS